MLDQAAPPDEPVTAAADRPARRQIPLTVVAIVAGLIVGGGIIAVLASAGVFHRPPDQGDAAADLIAAYERSRNATYAFDGEFSRTLADGRRLVSGALVAQRPPDEVRRQLGGTSGRINGRNLNCSSDINGDFSCAPGAEVEPWDQMVAHELDNLRSYFDPTHPVYTVTRQPGGCFELTLVATIADPPYGTRSVMCFDDPTGAMRSIELDHDNGAVDRLEASVIRGVTPQDFSLEANPSYDGHEEGG